MSRGLLFDYLASFVRYMTTEMKVLHVVTLQVCFKVSYMFSSMFSSMFTRDRGFIFFRTNIFEILKIYLGNFLVAVYVGVHS